MHNSLTPQEMLRSQDGIITRRQGPATLRTRAAGSVRVLLASEGPSFGGNMQCILGARGGGEFLAAELELLLSTPPAHLHSVREVWSRRPGQLLCPQGTSNGMVVRKSQKLDDRVAADGPKPVSQDGSKQDCYGYWAQKI